MRGQLRKRGYRRSRIEELSPGEYIAKLGDALEGGGDWNYEVRVHLLAGDSLDGIIEGPE